MVAVVVPSPAESLVFWATALTSLAAMFSKGSARSISLETVTPSFPRGAWERELLLHDLGEHVALAQDLVPGAFDLHLVAAVLAVEDLVAGGDGAGAAAAVVQQLAGADGDHLAALRLLLGGVRQ